MQLLCFFFFFCCLGIEEGPKALCSYFSNYIIAFSYIKCAAKCYLIFSLNKHQQKQLSFILLSRVGYMDQRENRKNIYTNILIKMRANCINSLIIVNESFPNISSMNKHPEIVLY